VRGLATKGSAPSFTDLARRLPKTYQKPAASTAAELGRLFDIDAAGNVRRKQDGRQSVKTATVRPAIAGAQSAIAAAQPDIAIEQRSSSVAPHPAISGAQAEIAAAQPEIAVEQRAPPAAAAQTVAATAEEGISAEQLLSFLATRRKSQIW
jgi:hypothetical protein